MFSEIVDYALVRGGEIDTRRDNRLKTWRVKIKTPSGKILIKSFTDDESDKIFDWVKEEMK